MKVIIAGTRDLPISPSYLDECIRESGFNITMVISGCSGTVDYQGILWARLHGIPIDPYPYPPMSDRTGGPLRNAKMAHVADALILIWDGKSKGSRNMLRNAQAKGLKIFQKVSPELA